MNVLYLLSFILTFTEIYSLSEKNSCYEDICFTVVRSQANYSIAAEECRKLNLTLAFVANSIAQTILQTYVNSTTDTFYIGLKYIPNERFIWDSKSVMVPNLTWAKGINIKSEALCVYLNDNFMNVGACNERRNYICSNGSETNSVTNVTGKCMEGSFKFSNKCYTMNLNCNDEQLKWDDANLKCKALNNSNSLVVIDSMIEQEFLTALMTISPQATWMGLRYHNVDDVFNIWVDIYKKMPHYSINFKSNEPNNMKGLSRSLSNIQADQKEECLMAYHRPSDVGKINDESCVRYLNYICESPLLPNSNPIVPETPHPLFHRGKCKKDYFQFNETCYKVVNTSTTYNESVKICSGKLLFVHGFIDLAFIRSLMVFKEISNSWINVSKTEETALRFNPQIKHNDNKNIILTSCYYIDSTKKDIQLANCSDKFPSVCYEDSHEKQTDNLVCPLNWVKVGRKCFKVVQQVFLNFNQAQSECKIYNGKLATFNNMKELMALTIQSSVWIGLNGTSYLNNSWIDGTTINYCRYRHTKDITSEIKNNSNNLCFFLTLKKEFNIKNCDTRTSIACETPAIENKCPKDFHIYIDGDCFGAFKINKTWDKAEEYCQDHGGTRSHLVSFHSMDQEALLLSQLNSNSYWIGLRKYDNTLRWIDESPINYHQSEYVSNLLSEGLSCYSTKQVSNKSYSYWSFENCGNKKYFICKISRNKQGINTTKINQIQSNYFCPKDFVKHGLSCYKYFTEHLTWIDSVTRCKQLFKKSLPKANLASFDNLQQYESLLSSLKHENASWIWIGLSENRETHQLLWSDERSFEIMKHSFNVSSKEEYTVAMELSTNPFLNGRWLMFPRLKNFPYICRVDPHKLFNENEDNLNAQSYTSQSCNSSFVKYNGNCYYYNPNRLNFDSANKKCTEMGADLLVLEDTFEENFVRALAGEKMSSTNKIWIGLKVNSLRNWSTTSATPVYYTHWNQLGTYENSYTYVYDNPEFKVQGCYVLRLNSGITEDNGMARLYCNSSIQSICKTKIPQQHQLPTKSKICGTSVNGTLYNLDVTRSSNNKSCIRWDLVMLKNPYFYHLNMKLVSSEPFNKDGYISYSLNRCSEIKNESKIHGYSCYIFENRQFILKDCLFTLCDQYNNSNSKSANGHPFLVVLLSILIISAICFIIYVYRKNLLSIYRVRVFMASVLGRYQPDCLRDSHSRSQTGTPGGGTGFVNPIYTPLESRY